MARYWTPGDGVFVRRLIGLRSQLEELGAGAPLGMYAATLALERTLYLTPGARSERLRTAGAQGPAPVAAPSGGSRRASARERERLLRG